MEQKEEYLGCGYTLLLIVLSGVSVMLMWNYGLAKAFNLEHINFWQALIFEGFVSYVVPYPSIKDNEYALTELVNKSISKAIVSAALIFIVSLFL